MINRFYLIIFIQIFSFSIVHASVLTFEDNLDPNQYIGNSTINGTFDINSINNTNYQYPYDITSAYINFSFTDDYDAARTYTNIDSVRFLEPVIEPLTDYYYVIHEDKEAIGYNNHKFYRDQISKYYYIWNKSITGESERIKVGVQGNYLEASSEISGSGYVYNGAETNDTENIQHDYSDSYCAKKTVFGCIDRDSRQYYTKYIREERHHQFLAEWDYSGEFSLKFLIEGVALTALRNTGLLDYTLSSIWGDALLSSATLHADINPVIPSMSVPEPSILALLGLGLLGMFGINRRKVQA